MPWKETCTMEERAKFIERYLTREGTFSGLCRYYGISRKTGYKWIQRFHEKGKNGLCDEKRSRKSQERETDRVLIDEIIKLRERHKQWGPRKLFVYLLRQDPSKPWPKPSTIAKILKQRGLVHKTKRRHRPRSYISTFGGYYGPNALWTADYKGQMHMRDGWYCYPLTIQDTCSRYLLETKSTTSTDYKSARRIFDASFCEYGLPDAIRTDNGSPFASVGLGGLSELSKWWIKLGIKPERIQRGKPNQNGRHERMHRDLKAVVEQYVKLSTKSTVQPHLDAFKVEYNTQRPHEALNYKTPHQVYIRSTKSYPVTPKDPRYPVGHFVERVDKSGNLHFMGQTFFVSPLIRHELIGIKPANDDTFHIYFGPLLLGKIGPFVFRSDRKKIGKRKFKPL